ncbi:nucleic acid dioxygenase ALKBH1 [Latimeria chalumnae]|uniref:Nucleic acid dioxygenase ALKBH1 n=1 Tax=Latimeria chalumnae TaxID=7897 RepID=H3B0B0_LATCH|nr:PREDICTED: alkylated DNA repair protein alkB homolog 1 [Latimeria chalumnae]|eukprot:XP_005990146.1 PREDICTED: alkylated DNA repair protein alkB homolog 1 [Latimeria chalumnae]
MAALKLEQGEEAFRTIFKFYKRRSPPADLSQVIDFSHSAAHTHGKVFHTELKPSLVTEDAIHRAGLQPVQKWKAYGLTGYPGFIFIANPFLPGTQHHWVKQCLKTYPQKPNVCNLDMHMSPKETTDLWGNSKEQIRQKGLGRREPKSLLEKLRWVTLGYHYDWNTKKYSADHHSAFPSDLVFLSEQVASACGFPCFRPEAGILNYYHMDSSLGIHVDEAELDQSKPLLSFSFGQTSIFLLGGLKREDPPTPMFMRSGDIMVMSGSSRLLYHAVPRILPNPEGLPLPRCFETVVPESSPQGSSILSRCAPEDWEICAKYLVSCRINMTVRQVLGVGQSFPTQEDNRNTATQQDSYHEETTDLEMREVKQRKMDS